MKLVQKIRTQINKLPEGETFGYADLGIAKADYQSAAKVMERLQKKGIIKKTSKGIFYKPEQTKFGELKPNEAELLKPYLFDKGKRIAYITGYALYNRLGLTTQMAFRYSIASRSKRISINSGTIKAKPVKSYAEVTDENYEVLGFLDAMKDLKKIPDTDTKTCVAILSGKIKNLNTKQAKEMVDYAMLYPPRVRALLGAILEKQGRTAKLIKIKESINPLSQYKLGVSKSILSTAPNWNIK